MVEGELDLQRLLSDLEAILHSATSVLNDDDADLSDIQSVVIKDIAGKESIKGPGLPAIVDRLMRAAEILLRLEDGERNKLARALIKTRVGEGQLAEFHIDLLTGVWLGLYFLGLPFNDPWDRARQIIDELGGYPSGASFNKGIGDVYRTARIIFTRDFNMPAMPAGGNEVTVLTQRSIGLVPLELLPEIPFTDPLIANLGRSYTWLQLRLYIACDLPLRYYVRRSAWNAMLKQKQSQDADGQWLRRSAAMTAKLFSKPGSTALQKLLFIEAPVVEGIPNCYLGYRGGMYSVGDRPTIRVAGSRVSRDLASSYRETLHKIEAVSTSICINGKSAEELSSIFVAGLNGTGALLAASPEKVSASNSS